MKKLLILVLVLMLTLSFTLTACGNKDDDGSDGNLENSSQNGGSTENSGSETEGGVENGGTSIPALKYSEGLEFSLNEDEKSYSVTGIGDCKDTDVVIPEKYNSLPVTAIAEMAFLNCSSLTNVAIPSSVTHIGLGAFGYCSSLTRITIPDSVTSIGEYAFYNCSSLTNVSIPDSVTSIGSSAFDGCSSLQYNEYDNAYYLGNESNPYIVLVKAKDTSITSCTIHNNTKVICSYAFSGCSSLTSVSIPDSVTSIGYNAFFECSSLQYNEYDNAYYLGNESNPYIALVRAKDTSITSCTIHNNTKFIHSDAFLDCRSLTSITIPDSVTSIGYDAFYYCSSLTSITIPDSVTSIGDVAFFRCSSLTNIKVSEDNQWYKDIDGNLYSKDGKVLVQYAIGKTDTTFIIPDSVTSIGDSAFFGCSSLTSVSIPDSVTSIGSYAFYYCSSLTSVTIGNSITSIGEGTFSYFSSLTSITIPNGVTSIGDMAFSGCSSLQYNEYDNAYYLGNESNPYVVLMKAKDTSITSCTIHNNTKFIHSDAFSDCRSLTSITIPDSVTYIGSKAFYGCSSLTSIIIPDGVTSIRNSAFEDCSSLKSVIIGNSVTSIGSYAFYGCSSLKTIYYTGTDEEWTAISIGSANYSLDNATVYYYSKEEPTEEGNFWYYDTKGNINVW